LKIVIRFDYKKNIIIVFLFIQDLLQSIQAQRELVEQAAAAIAFCRKKHSYNGTLQEVD